MTTETTLAKLRRVIQDTDSTHYHWTDESLKNDIQDAIISLNKIRPDTRYVKGNLVDHVTLPTSASDPIDLDDMFEDCIVSYAAHLAYSDDCTDDVSKKLSDGFLEKFMAFAIM